MFLGTNDVDTDYVIYTMFPARLKYYFKLEFKVL